VNCGKTGHKIAACSSSAWCSICAQRRRKADHRAGSEVCPPVPPRRTTTGVRSKEVSHPAGAVL
jgi:hypothetical protein